MKKLGEFIPHLSICLQLCLLVFMVLDGYNPYLKWLTSPISKGFIVLTCTVGLITAVMLIVRQRRRRVKKKEPPQENPEV